MTQTDRAFAKATSATLKKRMLVSQATISRDLGISASIISRYFNGRTTPSASIFVNMVRAGMALPANEAGVASACVLAGVILSEVRNE
jgi:predicted transcriptional regulator